MKFQTIKWNTGSAATRFRLNEKKKKRTNPQARKRVGPPIKKNKTASLTASGL
jgi:hypothetical protein